MTNDEFGLELNPEETAEWESYGRARAEMRRREKEFVAGTRRHGRAMARKLTRLFGVKIELKEGRDRG